jgi:hypothetical protein
VATEYDGVIYPGEITEIVGDDYTISVMVTSGGNKFKWPAVPDTLKYSRAAIQGKIGNPIPCSHRMREFYFDGFP